MEKPNSEERAFLIRLGYNPDLFMYISRDWESFTFIGILQGRKMVVRR